MTLVFHLRDENYSRNGVGYQNGELEPKHSSKCPRRVTRWEQRFCLEGCVVILYRTECLFEIDSQPIQLLQSWDATYLATERERERERREEGESERRICWASRVSAESHNRRRYVFPLPTLIHDQTPNKSCWFVLGQTWGGYAPHHSK